MRGIGDALFLPQTSGGRESDSRSVEPHIAVEREAGRDDAFHGFFAVRFDAFIDPAVRKDAKRETELIEQLKFVETLMALEIGQSAQLRLIASPTAESHPGGRIDVVLVFHAVAVSEGHAQEAAADLWDNVRTHLVSLAERYQFAPIATAEDLFSLLHPFDWNDVAEIARRERVVSLNGREGLYLVCPFIPTSRNMSRVCGGLLAQREPLMFCVTLCPTRRSPTERHYFEGPLVRRNLAQHPGVVSLPDSQCESRRPWASGPTPSDVSGLALQTIHVVGEGKISSALLTVIGSEISHPSAAEDLSKDLLDRPYSGGFVWQRAVGSAKAHAIRSVQYHTCDSCPDSQCESRRPWASGPTPSDVSGLALQTIHVVGEGKISSALLTVIGSEISHPSAAEDLSKDLLDRPYSGGFVWQRAVGSAKAHAIRSVQYHTCDSWMDSCAPEGLERLRYLVDPHQASAAFRIPFSDDGDVVPGIRLQPTIPFRGGSFARDGALIGISRHGMTSAEVRLDADVRQRHCYIQGATGTGKTTMIINLASQDIMAGSGVIVIDFHGDLCQELLQRIPPSRANDVVYFNPADTEFPIGLNLLAYDPTSPYREQQKERVIDFMTSYLTRQFPIEIIGPVFFQAFRNAMHLIMANDEDPGTLLDIPLVFLDEQYMRRKLAHMPPSLARRFWEQGYNHKKGLASSDGSSFAQYVTSKFSSLVDMSLTRNIFGQVTSKLDFREVMDQRKILLCNFSKGLLGGTCAELLSFITLFKIEDAALSRSDTSETDRARCALYIDECQNLQTQHFPQLLAEMRKYGINITLCNQHFSQLVPEMQDSIIANCGTLILFRSGIKDAEALEPALYPFDKRLILRQPNFQAVVKTLVDGAVKLFTIEALQANRPDREMAAPQDLIERSRVAFGVKRCEVEEQVLAKLNLGQPAAS